MAAHKTCLSAGIIINKLLTEHQGVMAIATDIFPVVESKAECPYVVYRRASLDSMPTKGYRPADTVAIEVECYAKGYLQCVELAEEVRDALENRTSEADGLKMRSCTLENAVEMWDADAHIQQLIFNVKI